MIVNKCEVKTYTDSYPSDYGDNLIVESANFDNNMVILKFGDKRIKVVGKDLITAIENCMHINKWG